MNDFIFSAKRTIDMECAAVHALHERIDDKFSHACQILLSCKGKVVVTGMGKSGHIANKIAATLASTGTSAFFVHPGEANHGDLGMISPQDAVIALSNSGTTAEILTLVPMFKRMNVPIISLTGNIDSTLATAATVNLDVSVAKEACPLDLAPTSSTTVSLVMGDAIAVALLEARGFSPEDFAFSHPGGALGRKLLLRVSDVMHSDNDIPQVNESALLSSALTEMTSKSLGMTTVVDNNQQLVGIFTDGDLRRCIDKGVNILTMNIRDVMNKNPRTINVNSLAVEALNIMEEYKITALVVEDNQRAPLGIVHMHNLLRAGIV